MAKKYQVTQNEKNGTVFIKDTRTGKEWQLQPYEFIYNSLHFNDVVDKFPNYVHDAVWTLNAKRM